MVAKLVEGNLLGARYRKLFLVSGFRLLVVGVAKALPNFIFVLLFL